MPPRLRGSLANLDRISSHISAQWQRQGLTGDFACVLTFFEQTDCLLTLPSEEQPWVAYTQYSAQQSSAILFRLVRVLLFTTHPYIHLRDITSSILEIFCLYDLVTSSSFCYLLRHQS